MECLQEFVIRNVLHRKTKQWNMMNVNTQAQLATCYVERRSYKIAVSPSNRSVIKRSLSNIRHVEYLIKKAKPYGSIRHYHQGLHRYTHYPQSIGNLTRKTRRRAGTFLKTTIHYRSPSITSHRAAVDRVCNHLHLSIDHVE